MIKLRIMVGLFADFVKSNLLIPILLYHDNRSEETTEEAYDLSEAVEKPKMGSMTILKHSLAGLC